MHSLRQLSLLLGLSLCGGCLNESDRATNPFKPAKEPVRLQPRWRQGETKTYLVTTKVATTGKRSAERTRQHRLEVSVLEAGPGGCLLRWNVEKHSACQSADDSPSDNEIVEWERTMAGRLFAVLDEATDGRATLIEADSGGQFRGVKNWEELRDLMGAGFASFAGKLRRGGAPPRLLHGLRQFMAVLFSSRPRTEETLTADFRSWNKVLGRTYDPDKPLEFEHPFDNPRGGEAFTSKVKCTLQGLDGLGRAVITWKGTVDSGEVRRVARKTEASWERHLQRKRKNTSKPFLGYTSLTEETTFRVDPASGWVEQMERSMTYQLKDGTKRVQVTLEPMASH